MDGFRATPGGLAGGSLSKRGGSRVILAAIGVLAAAGCAAAAILLPPGRRRGAALLAALALFPLLILADQWNTPQIIALRDEPVVLIALALLLTATGVAALAAAFHRWPLALPLAIVATLPFRVPLQAGGDTANLLIPLYLVIAAGVLSTAFRDWSRPDATATRAGGVDTGVPSRVSEGSPVAAAGPARRSAIVLRRINTPDRLLPTVLAAVVVLYALQTLYSPDFSKSLQNLCFFFIPFTLAFVLIRDQRWDARLLRLTLAAVALSAVAFVIVGSVEFVSGSLFWNDQVIRSNEFHTYFRVNSVFWDPNIYGRYLALAIVLLTAALLWARQQRTLALLTALIAVLWLGLFPTFSQSSFAALLAGLATLAAVRWSLRWTLATVAVGALLAVIVVLFVGGNAKVSLNRVNVDTGGRANLVEGGARLFSQRPLWGYGAGSFPRAYRERVATKKAPVAESHTEPITVAAEQGLIGLIAYFSLLFTALWTMSSGLTAPLPTTGPARCAVLAAFIALVVHTLSYAGFYEDPIAWTLLAVGASLAAAPAVRDPA